MWLVNPQGVVFGAGAQVNVGGLLASTANISNENFMAGNYRFDQPGNPAASIINQGSITVAEGGLAALVAPEVRNSGIIVARLGKVALGAGEAFTLDPYGDGPIEFQAGGAVQQLLVEHSGTISAEGGHVLLTTADMQSVVDSLIDISGAIDADTMGDQAGRIVIHAPGGTVMMAGDLSAQGLEGAEAGGRIEVLGDRVALLNGSVIDASGNSGGGTMLVGGDYQGQGVTPTASRVIVQAGASSFANALKHGDGGTAIVWSDVRTDFGGHIEARGGALSGDGGFVETSGKESLMAVGTVDASSPWGLGGAWLLDPNNITINTTANANVGSSGANPVVWDTTDDTAVVTVASILTSLNAGTSVTIQTGTAGANTQAGNITVASAIAKSAGGDATLTLKAHESIIVNADISSTSGKLHTVLNADSDANSSGYVNIAGNITSNGGNIAMGGGADPATGYAVGNAGQAAGIYINNKAVNAGGGNIVVRGKGFDTTTDNNYGVRATGATGALTTTGSGTLTVTGVGQGNTDSGSNYGVYVDTGGNLSAADGALTVTGTGGGSGASGNNVGVIITGAVATVKTTGSGTIAIDGTGGNGTSDGVFVSATNGIQALGTGDITVTGTSSAGGSGVNVSGSITGAANHNVTVTGTGGGAGASGWSNYGVYVNGGSITGASGYNVTVTGTGGNNSGSDNVGVRVTAAGGAISTSGSGTVTVTGTGAGTANSGSDYGVEVDAGGIISAVDGAISVTGTGGGAGTGTNNYGVYLLSTGGITSTGSGAITVTGIRGGGNTANNYGLTTLTGTNTIGGASATGDVTIVADTLSLAASSVFQPQ